ncbi:trypsin-like peptidase domain-containing protein [bacterium]|nr:trypsin-like peptidase domain-containing protein [bacterium]
MDRRGAGVGCVVLIALVFGLIGGGLGGYLVSRRAAPRVTVTEPLPASGPTSKLEVQSESSAIVRAVKTAGPSVVKVIAAQAAPMDPMHYLFGGQPQEQVAIGSGFVFNHGGRQLVLTNNHVAGGADKLVVKLTDGREMQGRLAGASDVSDIAVIELVNPPSDLRSATLGDSDKLQVGEWAIAIGNPYDYEHTVTVGVVSAMGYRSVSRDRYQNVIQTDAAINTGNSGGPLINLAGQVVGINYMIFSPTGATVGIGFAIPINSAKRVLYYLTYGGPYIGLEEEGMIANSPGLAQYFGLSTPAGVLVAGLDRNSPAFRAGVRPRDVVLAVNGAKVQGPDQLRDEILKRKIGETITLSIQRDAQQVQVPMVAGRHPGFRGG